MGPQRRMLGMRELRAARLRGLAALIISRAVVNRGQSREKALHRIRERVVRRVHICEERIASSWRNFLEMKYRGHWRLRIARYVGVPGLARDPPGILIGLDDDDFGMPFEDAERRRMKVEFAEASAESFVLIGSQILLTKENNQVSDERVANLGEKFFVERLRKIDALDFRADRRRQFAHRYRH